MQSAIKCNTCRRMWVLQLFNIDKKKWDQIIRPFSRIGSAKEIRPPLFNLRKLKKKKLRKVLLHHV